MEFSLIDTIHFVVSFIIGFFFGGLFFLMISSPSPLDDRSDHE